MDNTMFISNREYDCNPLRKVAAVNSHLGLISIHDAPGGYLLSFTGCPLGPQKAMALYSQYLVDLTNNIWSH